LSSPTGAEGTVACALSYSSRTEQLCPAIRCLNRETAPPRRSWPRRRSLRDTAGAAAFDAVDAAYQPDTVAGKGRGRPEFAGKGIGLQSRCALHHGADAPGAEPGSGAAQIAGGATAAAVAAGAPATRPRHQLPRPPVRRVRRRASPAPASPAAAGLCAAATLS